MADNFFELYDRYGTEYGLPNNALRAIAELESNHDPAAQNPNSSAGGLFQFVDQYAPAYGLTGNKRFDPEEATRAAAQMARENARVLKRALGREPTAPELYLAHQQGAGGAAALLKNPGQPAIDVLTRVYGGDRERARQVIIQNGGKTNQTSGQFAGQWTGKAEKVLARIPPSDVPSSVASRTDTTRPVPPSMPVAVPADMAANRQFQQTARDAFGANPQMGSPDPASIYSGFYAKPPAPPAPKPSMIFDRGITDSVEIGQAAQNHPALAAALEAQVAASQRPPVPPMSGAPISYAGTERSLSRPVPAMPIGAPQSYANAERAPVTLPAPPMPMGTRQSYAAQERSPGRSVPPMPTGQRQSYAATERAPTGRTPPPMPTGGRQSFAAQDGQGGGSRAPRNAVSASMERSGAATARNETLQQQLERRIAAYNGDDRGGGTGTTIATIPTSPRLPPIPPSNSAVPRTFDVTRQRTAEASKPELAAALNAMELTPQQIAMAPYTAGERVASIPTKSAPRQPTAAERAAIAYVPPSREATPAQVAAVPYGSGSMVASIPTNPRIGQPPTTRSVPSVPPAVALAPVARPAPPRASTPGPMDDIGSMPSWAAFQGQFGTPSLPPRVTVARPAPPNPALGPDADFVKPPASNERLVSGLPYPATAIAEHGLPSGRQPVSTPPAIAVVPATARATGYPTSASQRPGSPLPGASRYMPSNALPSPVAPVQPVQTMGPPALPAPMVSVGGKPNARPIAGSTPVEQPFDFGEAVGDWWQQTPAGRLGNAVTGRPQAEWDGWGMGGLIFNAPLARNAHGPIGAIRNQMTRAPQPPPMPVRRNSNGNIFGMVFGGGNQFGSLSAGPAQRGAAQAAPAATTRAGFLSPTDRAATLVGINPSNHSQAQLDAVAAGRSYYTGSDGGMQPTHAMNGKLRNTY